MSKIKTIFLILCGLGAVILGWNLYLTYFESEPPSIILTPTSKFISPNTKLSLALEDKKQGLKHVSVYLIQNNQSIALLDKDLNQQKSLTISFELPKSKIKPGILTLEIKVWDSSWKNFGQGNLTLLTKKLTYDPMPPRFSILSKAHYLNQGGSGLIVFTLNEKVKKAGIKLDNYFFPAYYNPSQNKYYCIFAWPYSLSPDHEPLLIAEDLAGNVAQTTFYYHVNPKKFPHENINISDSFLKRKMPYFKQYFPHETNLLTLFLKVNRTLRKQNRQQLKKLGQDTSNIPLFSGVFKRLPNSAQKASFGEIRDYFYHGQKIDRQTHLGLDLASIARAKVPAANKGRVIFAGQMGIYGNVVIIDHGLGLQTLYAHLSEIKVTPGEIVQKGQTIGRTGSTGLAGGDHLHFAVLVSGLPVNPIEWLDKHWLQNNIYDRLY
ncbi:MAG: M23 family metallopeptidase [Desulfonauticus sp.]|nr:M23 family metallopeptidase [Desulfonauticus sp.]